MQTRAVIEAAIAVKKEMNYDIVPEIMVPLTGERKELLFVKNIIVETAEQVMKEQGYFLNYQVGTMIEIPRAALTADDVAKEADFFSFGTNDLTQMTFGFSRDDAGKFLESYYDQKIYEFDPFSKLDQTGVGQLMQMAVKKGRQENPMLHCGICGEHGGDPPSGKPDAALRYLRRTRRRSFFGSVLPGTGPGLRVLLALPRTDCPAGGSPGSH